MNQSARDVKRREPEDPDHEKNEKQSQKHTQKPFQWPLRPPLIYKHAVCHRGRVHRAEPETSDMLHAVRGAQVLTKERQYEVLETDGYGAGVRARINLECVGDAVAVEDLVQLRGAGS